MDKKRIHEIAKALAGLTAMEWSRVKQKIDMQFSSKAAKVELDDLELLKANLESEFNLRRFGERSD